MAPLASWMSCAGHKVVGYDDNLQENIRRLLNTSGVELMEFVFPEQMNAFTQVVFSSAIRPDHPLLTAALRQGLKTVRRGEMLAEIAASRRLVAIVGSHGKTTTAGMLAHASAKSGFDSELYSGWLAQ